MLSEILKMTDNYNVLWVKCMDALYVWNSISSTLQNEGNENILWE